MHLQFVRLPLEEFTFWDGISARNLSRYEIYEGETVLATLIVRFGMGEFAYGAHRFGIRWHFRFLRRGPHIIYNACSGGEITRYTFPKFYNPRSTVGFPYDGEQYRFRYAGSPIKYSWFNTKASLHRTYSLRGENTEILFATEEHKGSFWSAPNHHEKKYTGTIRSNDEDLFPVMAGLYLIELDFWMGEE